MQKDLEAIQMIENVYWNSRDSTRSTSSIITFNDFCGSAKPRERERKESPLYLLHLILSKMKEQNRLFSCGFLLVIGADALVSCWMMMTRYFFLTLLLSLEMSSGSNPESAKLHYTHRESERCVRVSVRVSMLFIV